MSALTKVVRTGWVASASNIHVDEVPDRAVDGDSSTLWSNGVLAATGQWFEVDMLAPQTFAALGLDAAGNTGDYPRAFCVKVSNDHVNWTTVTSAVGTSALVTVAFPLQTARYVRVELTAAFNSWWSMAEFNVYGPVLSRTSWTATASASLVGDPPFNALDGTAGTRFRTSTDQAPGQFFQVDMKARQTFNQITLDAGTSANEYPRGYEVYVSNDGSTWGSPIATGTGSAAFISIAFAWQWAQYVKVVQTATSPGNGWAIHDFEVYGQPTELAVLSQAGWTATKSPAGSGSAAPAFDGNATTTSWTTNPVDAAPGQWFRLDMGSLRKFSQVTLDTTAIPTDYPPGYEVSVSTDGTTWSTPIASGAPTTAYLTIGFAPQTARYVKITQTGSASHRWTIYELNVYGVAIARTGWVVTGSANSSGNVTSKALDNDTGTRWDTSANQTNGQFFQVDLVTPHVFNELTVDAGKTPNNYPRNYEVRVSNDGTTWGSAIASGAGTSGLTTITFPTQTARFVKITQTGSASVHWSIYEVDVWRSSQTCDAPCVPSDQCHDAGTCDPGTGVCSNPAKANGTTCSDGNACTQTDTCVSGMCTGATPVTCTASDQCHDAGTCNTSTGVCSNPAKANGTTCSDGNACTQTDTCVSGTCTGASPVTCTASDQCHDAGTCNTSTGVCSNPAKANGTTCSDGNACTQADTCVSGTCTGASPVTCTASDQCHDVGACNTTTGVCSNPVKANGTTCSDGNACTQADTCVSGTCTGASPMTCTASDQCHDVGTCNTTTGVCTNPAKANGSTCSDGNACTQADTCVSGTCTGASPVTCTASDQCHDVGTCNTGTGVCSNPAKANGTTCSDGNACTQTDTCVSGTCTGGNTVACTASGQCHDVGTCSPATGVCSTPPKTDGTICSDGNSCTSGDSCQSGVCASGQQSVCGIQGPPIDQTAATDFAKSTSFLYSGANPVQTGVAPGTIQARRVAVLHGKVTTREGAPLTGVAIRVHQHSEFGQTTTRGDGLFDIAVNGGGYLTLVYEKAGYLTAQRNVETPWRDLQWVPQVSLVSPDPEATVVSMASPVFQVAQASVTSDQDGLRQLVSLVQPNTTATMVFPDGSTQPLAQMTVRSTEYTVGESGPSAMPADLPPGTAYTYAIEQSADEAVAAGARSITFSKPVIDYVDNFLDYEVGDIVPSGYYDTTRGAWVTSKSGKVIKIVDTTVGLAEIDVDGDGLSDSAMVLATLGITDEERMTLAQLYLPGKSLWRVPVDHFTAWDFNYGLRMPDGAQSPNSPFAQSPQPISDPCNQAGSIIQCQNQTLGESIPIVGTDLELQYWSHRNVGYKAANRVIIPILGDYFIKARPNQPPLFDPLQGVGVVAEVTGGSWDYTRQTMTAYTDFTRTLIPFDTRTFQWNGTDAFGRTVQGSRPTKLELVYYYLPVRGVSLFEYDSETTSVAFDRNRPPPRANRLPQDSGWIRWSRRQNIRLGIWNARPLKLGGWNLDIHHAYDPETRILYRGDGTSQEAPQAVDIVAKTFAGTGAQAYGGDSGPATSATLVTPMGVAAAADGSIYVADYGSRRVRKIDPVGIISTFAGNGVFDHLGDGGLATQAAVGQPSAVAVAPDGTVYISDGAILRRVGADGIIRRIAGGNTPGVPDGGPAINARFSDISGMAIDRWGNIYINSQVDSKVFKITADGTIRRFAGTVAGFGGDGGSAKEAQINHAQSIAVGPDGAVFVADKSNYRIRKISPDGTITTVVGTGASLPTDKVVELGVVSPVRNLEGMAVDGAGNLYFSDNHRIRRLGTDGYVHLFAADPADFAADTWTSEGYPAKQVVFSHFAFNSIAVAPDGSVYVSDSDYHQVFRFTQPMPGFSSTDYSIPSTDGAEFYRFDVAGRHLGTHDARTGALIRTFQYTPEGLLSSTTNADGLVTTIERDPAGEATGIVSPTGQRTTLAADAASGYLGTITNPAGEATHLTYRTGGLLETLTTPRGHLHQFQYDDLGRLIHDSDPSGGSWTLSRTDIVDNDEVSPLNDSSTVQMTTALGKTNTYETSHLGDRTEVRVTRGPDGLATTDTSTLTGVKTLVTPEQVTTTTRAGPHPVYGMMSPSLASLRVDNGTAHLQATHSASSTRDPVNPALESARTDQIVVNGRSYQETWDGALRTLTSRTPTGRNFVKALDSKGRLVGEQAPGRAAFSYHYDGRGRIDSITAGAGASARNWALVYDEHDRLQTLADPSGGETGFQYNAANRLTARTFSDGAVVSLGVDSGGNVTSVVPPERPGHGMNYTPVDLLESHTSPALSGIPTATTYEYDEDRRLLLAMRPDGQTSSFTYDTASRLSGITAPAEPGVGTPRSVTVTYSPTRGNVSTMNTADGENLTFSYSGSLLTSVASSGSTAGTVSVGYDNDFRPNTETVNGVAVTLGYDGDGLTTQLGALAIGRAPTSGAVTGSTLGSLVDVRDENDFGEQLELETKLGSTTLYKETVTRDASGRVETKTETVGGVATTFTYGYDNAQRLWQVMQDGSLTATYEYDANGNRTSRTTPGGIESGIADAQDRLLTYGRFAFTYASDGDLRTKTDTTTSAVTTYGYDGMGNLRRVDLPDGRVIQYAVDGLNRRIAKKVDGVTTRRWLYRDAQAPVAELNASGAVVTRIVAGEYLTKGGSTYRIVKDHLGSPRLIVNAATGAVAQRLDFDEFGRVISDSAPGFQPIGFAGGLYDPDTGLVRFGARDYDPEIGRWTSKDPARFEGENLNLYSYVGNDPINYADPDGQVPVLIITAFTSALTDLAIQGVSLLAQGKSLKCINWRSVGAAALTGAALGGILSIPGRIGAASGALRKVFRTAVDPRALAPGRETLVWLRVRGLPRWESHPLGGWPGWLKWPHLHSPALTRFYEGVLARAPVHPFFPDPPMIAGGMLGATANKGCCN